MAKRNQKLTCTFFVGDKQVDSLTDEQLEKMSQRLGEAMSEYYTVHYDEYLKLEA